MVSASNARRHSRKDGIWRGPARAKTPAGRREDWIEEIRNPERVSDFLLRGRKRKCADLEDVSGKERCALRAVSKRLEDVFHVRREAGEAAAQRPRGVAKRARRIFQDDPQLLILLFPKSSTGEAHDICRNASR